MEGWPTRPAGAHAGDAPRSADVPAVSTDGLWRCVVLAIAFGVLSTPVVAWSFMRARPYWAGDCHAPESFAAGVSLTWPAAIAVALLAVVAAAGIGGTVGGLVVRRRTAWACFVATAISWPVGIVTASLAAGLLRAPVRAAYWGFMGACRPAVSDVEPLGSVGDYAISLMLGVVLIPFALLLLALALRIERRPRLAIVAGGTAVAAAALFNAWSIAIGDVLVFLCLAAGVVAWAIVLRRDPASEPT